uniref:Anaphase-promoting complex subunit 4 WD40 domain-containing protein n=1 Tax=Ascaris lumbricoides TaxID=6252 RepID=A0A9J2PL19_ASCLU
MDSIALVSDIVWIKRGVAKHVPEKVKLNPEELRELIQGNCGEPETSEQSESEQPMDDGDTERPTTGGLRGSAPDPEVDESQESGNYRMDKYDEEDQTDGVFHTYFTTKKRKNLSNILSRNAMAGIATFTTPLEDPYITRHVDSDEEEDKEDFEIKPDDNLVVVAKINKGEFGLEVYVYNEANDDWYVHHDYLLDAPPLCLEAIAFDPGADDGKGNLVGVGTMDSVVNIWDLDVVNAVEPIVALGGPHKKGKKHHRVKRDGTAQGHSDAVLCLSWNRITEHVLASGSADQTVILWDLEEAKAATILSTFGGKVLFSCYVQEKMLELFEMQSMEWHPGEASILLSGTLSGELTVADCRQKEAEASRKWKVDGEIEKVLWDHFNPFNFFVTTDDGKLRYMDSRVDKVVFECDAHEGGARCVSQSFHVRGLLSTCGADNKLKLWKLGENALEEIHSETLTLGGLHALRFSPDSGPILAIGGEKEDMIRVIGVDKFEPMIRAFSSS